jgi:hypothetical protein
LKLFVLGGIVISSSSSSSAGLHSRRVLLQMPHTSEARQRNSHKQWW